METDTERRDLATKAKMETIISNLHDNQTSSSQVTVNPTRRRMLQYAEGYQTPRLENFSIHTFVSNADMVY